MPSQSHFDAIALLKADHRKVEDLFAEFAAAKGAAKKQALVEKICAELSGHTVIEEELFYPACRGKVEDALLNEGYVEHDGSKVLIAELIASAPNEEFYDAKVKVLSERHRQLVRSGWSDADDWQWALGFIANPYYRFRPRPGIFGSWKLYALRQ